MNPISSVEFKRRFDEKYADKFEILTPYKTSKDKITIKCKTCTHIHEAIAEHLLYRKRRCPNCTKFKQYSFYDKITENIPDGFKLLNIINQKRVIEHLKCGSVFLIDRIKFNNRCPVCEEEAKHTATYSALVKKFGRDNFSTNKELVMLDGRKMTTTFYIHPLDLYIDLYGDFLSYPTGRPNIFLSHHEELIIKQKHCDDNKIKYCLLQNRNDLLDIIIDLSIYFKKHKCSYNHFCRWRRSKGIKKLKKK